MIPNAMVIAKHMTSAKTAIAQSVRSILVRRFHHGGFLIRKLDALTKSYN